MHQRADLMEPMARRVRLIASGVLAPIGVVVGLVQQSDGTGQSCGSILIPRNLSDTHIRGCEWALRGTTQWMWLMLGLSAFGVLSVYMTDLLSVYMTDRPSER
jgi:hypothetical protein